MTPDEAGGVLPGGAPSSNLICGRVNLNLAPLPTPSICLKNYLWHLKGGVRRGRGKETSCKCLQQLGWGQLTAGVSNAIGGGGGLAPGWCGPLEMATASQGAAHSQEVSVPGDSTQSFDLGHGGHNARPHVHLPGPISLANNAYPVDAPGCYLAWGGVRLCSLSCAPRKAPCTAPGLRSLAVCDSCLHTGAVPRHKGSSPCPSFSEPPPPTGTYSRCSIDVKHAHPCATDESWGPGWSTPTGHSVAGGLISVCTAPPPLSLWHPDLGL